MVVRSYIKIYGPPLLKALEALERVAVEMSKVVDLKFRHICVPDMEYVSDWEAYADYMRRIYVECYEPVRLISEASEMMGDYDFFFEWSERPTLEQVEELVKRIDEALSPLGCHYTITTKED